MAVVEAMTTAQWQDMLDGRDDRVTGRQDRARRLLADPAFRRWFAGSKIVDRQGLPLVLYHGTTANLPAFDKAGSGRNGDELGPGLYLTNDAAYAADFAEGTGGNVVAVYVSVRKIVGKTQAFRAMLRDPEWRRLGEIARDQDYDGLGKPLGRFARARGYEAIVAHSGPGIFQLCVFDPTRVRPAYHALPTATPMRPRRLRRPSVS